MSYERAMDPRDDPERWAAIQRENEKQGQQRLPFSESARPDPDEDVDETEQAVKDAVKRVRGRK